MKAPKEDAVVECKLDSKEKFVNILKFSNYVEVTVEGEVSVMDVPAPLAEDWAALSLSR